MKTILKTMLFIVVAATVNTNLSAQGLQMPQPSTAQTLTQAFGLGQ